MKKLFAIVLSGLLLVVLFVMTAGSQVAYSSSSPGQYSDYTTMLTPGNTTPGGTAGQLWTSTADSQFAWTPKGDGVSSDILWSTPATWPVGTIEHFTVTSNWIELSGWSNTNDGVTSTQDYTQTVTTQTLGIGNCATMLPIPVDNGHELYAMSTVPVSTYCLDAKGIITAAGNPTTVHFEHWTQWSQGVCSNAYYTGDTCIFQNEKWWDDNSHPFTLELDRTVAIAKGKGYYQAANRVVNGSPNTTVLNLKYYWLW